MKKALNIRDILLFRKSLIVEMDFDYLSRSLVFYRSIYINKNKISRNYIDINYLYRIIMINPYLYFNAKISKCEEDEGSCKIEVKLRDGLLILNYVTSGLFLLMLLYDVIVTEAIIILPFGLGAILFSFLMMWFLFDNSTNSLIKELRNIDPRFAKKYEEEKLRKTQFRRRK